MEVAPHHPESHSLCRYEDYEKEIDPSSLITPKKTGEVADVSEDAMTPMSFGSYFDDEMEQVESPEKRVGSNKLLGLPTPNGKSIYILTPKDKITDQYNVHWRYV